MPGASPRGAAPLPPTDPPRRSPYLAGITTYSTEQFLVIDAATRRNLELTATLRENRRGARCSICSTTRTAMGGRLLRTGCCSRCSACPRSTSASTPWTSTVRDRVTAEDQPRHLREVYDLER